MTSPAATVDEFLATLPAERAEPMTRLRAAIRAALPDAQERMAGMPIYSLEGNDFYCAFNSQKNYMALYVGRIPDALRPELKGCSLGKGCVRFKQLDDNLLAVFGKVLRNAEPC